MAEPSPASKAFALLLMARTDAEQAARSGKIKDLADCLNGMCAALGLMAESLEQIEKRAK